MYLLKMNSDQLADIKQFAPCNFQMSFEALKWLDRIYLPVWDAKETLHIIQRQNFAYSENSPVTFTVSTCNMMFKEQIYFHISDANVVGKIWKLPATDKLTSSWQVTGGCFPLWWLIVLIFQHMVAVHQSQQQMAIMPLPIKGMLQPLKGLAVDKQSSLWRLHAPVLE